MIVPLQGTENWFSLNVEDESGGLATVDVMHYTKPNGEPYVEVNVTRHTPACGYTYAERLS